MTSHPEWSDRLSDYLDDELDAGERELVAAHLAGCTECTQLLNELRSVVLVAQAAPVRQPSSDLWTGIATQIGAAPHENTVAAMSHRRFTFTLGQLAAAAVLLVAVSGWITFRFLAPEEPDRPITAGTGGAGDTTQDPLPIAELAAARMDDDPAYDAAIADLQQTLDDNRGLLDPATVKIVEDDLRIIDQAVDEARQALAKDPANDYLTEHLVETRRRKLDLLRHAAVLSAGLD